MGKQEIDYLCSKLGVAVVGLGVGEQHARSYLATGKCELRWLYDLDSERAQKLVQELGVGRIAESFEQIIQDPDVHVVSIASFDQAHFQQVVDTLIAGKHVFVEKPLCRSVSELQTIKRIWTEKEGTVKLWSNLVLRATPLYRWLGQQAREGFLGKLYAFDGDYLYGRLNKITEGWRKEIEDYSVMLGGGVHMIDLMIWITDQRPSRVWATGNRICTEGTQFAYLDYVTATFQFSSGLIGRITANFGCVHRHQHVLRVFGTDKTFLFDDMEARLHSTRDPSIRAHPVALRALPATKGDLIAPFVSAILRDENCKAQTQEVFDAISICNATDLSIQTNSMVEIHYV